MDIKSYNKLPRKIKILHSIILKRVEFSTFAKWFLFCREIYRGSIVVATYIGNWINKGNYPYALNFIYSFSHVVLYNFVFEIDWLGNRRKRNM